MPLNPPWHGEGDHRSYDGGGAVEREGAVSGRSAPPPRLKRRGPPPRRRGGFKRFTLAVLSLVLATAAPYDPALQFARLPDGRRLAFRCVGERSPTVIFEGGWAASSLAWTKVQRLVAPSNRACAYDRAGMGASDSGPDPRDGAAIARDLDDGLRALKIAGPFVVVGHSAGGLYVRLFADRRPADVAGMVLADPSVEFQDKRMSAVFGPGAGSIASLRDRSAACAAAVVRRVPVPDLERLRCDPAIPASTYRTEAAEIDSLWTTTSDEIAAGRQSYGALPLIVLTAGDTNASVPEPGRRAADRVWAGLHTEIAERSTAGVRRTVEGSSHLIPKDRPDAIAAAIFEVVKAGKGPS